MKITNCKLQNVSGRRFQQVALFIASLMMTNLAIENASAQNFNRDIRPILSDRCFQCHGPDSAANESGLRLDIAEQAYDSEAFVAGDLEASLAVERILTDDVDLKMPPPESHLNLTNDEIELLKRWVENGAKYDQHWAFKPVSKFMVVPHFSMIRDWIQNDIDVFVLRRLESEKLEPSPESEKWRWLRRVTYDLTGLPPTSEATVKFEADNSFDAYEKVVDRLLASEDFGKHMAVSWLDSARYADSYGYQSDQLSPTWPYRDWVVKALNENLPYNDFLKWQIAGDMLPDATKDQILATAFNRLHRMTNEGGSVELEWRTEYVADRVNTFGTAMLGLTLECARCHDHKFDPVTQKEYYSLSAFFNHIDEWGMYHDGSRVPTPSLLLPTPEQEKQLAEHFKNYELQLFDPITNRNDGIDTSTLDEWIKNNPTIKIVEPVAHWSLDEFKDKDHYLNSVAGGEPAKTSPANRVVDGYRGLAVQLTGDDPIEFPVEDNWLEPWQPFSISCWLKVPSDLDEGVILHRQGGTDVGTFGTSLRLMEGHLQFAMVRFWPGNAIAVRSNSKLPKDKWVHVVITNNGIGKASGMEIYLDGNRETVVLKDNLTKDPQHRPGDRPGFVVGEQFRRVGFRNGMIDEVSVYNVALTSVETAAIRGDLKEASVKDFTEAELAAHEFTVTRVNRTAMGKIRELLQARVSVTEVPVMKDMSGVSVAHTLHRGDYDSPRTEDNVAPRDTPSALPPMPADLENRNRMVLAEWLTSDDHPLTSRVAVNRIWQNFFGSGLIDTPNDLGYQSQMPIYSSLLNYLARDFMDNDWDVKRLCRKIVLSGTYRQTSTCDETVRGRDPENRLLARGPANRLSAEMVRDTALFSSGLLNNASGGPSVSPYQPANIWRENNTMTPMYKQSIGTALYRRSLYTVWKRTTPMPNMMTFDATSREVCVVQRSRTNTPQQAMVLLNDVQFVEAARVLAEKAIVANVSQVESNDEAMIQWMFVRLAGRKADGNETLVLNEILGEQRKRFREDEGNAKKLASAGKAPTTGKAPDSEVAAVTVVAQAILNSDATIWKR